MSSNIATYPRFRKSFAENSSNTSRLRPRRYAPRHRASCRRLAGLTELQHSRLQRARSVIRSMRDGVCDWSMAQWAKHFKLSKSQFRRVANAWVEVGLMEREPRTGNDYPNDTYLWRLPALANAGGGSINEREKPVQDLTTKTTTPAAPVVVSTPPKPPQAPPAPSPTQLACEARWQHDRECTRRMLAQREARFELDRQCHEWRKREFGKVEKAIEHRQRCGGSQRSGIVLNPVAPWGKVQQDQAAALAKALGVDYDLQSM